MSLEKLPLAPSTARAARKEWSASRKNARSLHAKTLTRAVSHITTAGDVWCQGTPEHLSEDTGSQGVWADTAPACLELARPQMALSHRAPPAQHWELPSSSLADPGLWARARAALTALWNPHRWFLAGHCRAGAAVTGELHEVIDDGLLVDRACWHTWAAIWEKLW